MYKGLSSVTNHEISLALTQAIQDHQAGRLEQAAQIYQQILSHDERNPVASNNLSLLLEPEPALKLLENALNSNPEYLDALINTCVRLIAKRDWANARTFVQRAQRMAPNEPRVQELINQVGFSTTASHETTLPLFTVIVPTHKRAILLARALESIQQQTLAGRHEVIVVSDYADAATDAVCLQWLKQNDTYVRRSGPPGPAASRNLALKLAKGQNILFLDDDDAWYPDFLASLEKSQPLREGRPVYFNCTVVKESRTSTGPVKLSESHINNQNRLTEDVFVKNQISNCCIAIPTILLKDIEFDRHLKAYEDWDFLLSIYERCTPVFIGIDGPIIHEVDDHTTDRRGSSTDANNINAIRDYLHIYHKHTTNQFLEKKRALFLKKAGYFHYPTQQQK
jgi:glycosyltransferase involved in cell wall biosynthesis